MSNSIAPGSSADVNVRVTALTTNPNVPVTYKTVILKKNLVNGVNTLTQEMMSATNTKYVIKYDYVLGENITVPANCILEFDGGSLSNGTITGQDIYITGNYVGNLDVIISGTNITPNFVVTNYNPSINDSHIETAVNGIIVSGEVAFDSTVNLNTSIKGELKDSVLKFAHGTYKYLLINEDNVVIENLTFVKEINEGTEANAAYAYVIRDGSKSNIVIRNCIIGGTLTFYNRTYDKYIENVTIDGCVFNCDFTNIADYAEGASDEVQKDVLILRGIKNALVNHNQFNTTNVNRCIKLSGGVNTSIPYSEIENSPHNIRISNNAFNCNAVNGKQIIDTYVTTEDVFVEYNRFNIISGHSVCFLYKNDADTRPGCVYFTNNIIRTATCYVTTISSYSDMHRAYIKDNDIIVTGIGSYNNIITLFCPFGEISGNNIISNQSSGNTIYIDNTQKMQSAPEPDFDYSKCTYVVEKNIFRNKGAIYCVYGNVFISNNLFLQANAGICVYVENCSSIKATNNIFKASGSSYQRAIRIRKVDDTYPLLFLDIDDNIYTNRHQNLATIGSKCIDENTILKTKLISINGSEYNYIRDILTESQIIKAVFLNKNTPFYNETLKNYITWNGFKFVDAEGYTAVNSRGTTNDRPVGRYVYTDGNFLPTDGRRLFVGYTTKLNTENKYYIATAINNDFTVTWTEESTIHPNVPADAPRNGSKSQLRNITAEYAYNNLYVGYIFVVITDYSFRRIKTLTRIGEGTESDPYVYNLEWENVISRTSLTKDDTGFKYYDTDINKTIYVYDVNYTGVVTWVDATGTPV